MKILPVMGLANSSGDLGPLGRFGVCCPGGSRFLSAAAAKAAILADRLGGSSISPGALREPLVSLVLRRIFIR